MDLTVEELILLSLECVSYRDEANEILKERLTRQYQKLKESEKKGE